MYKRFIIGIDPSGSFNEGKGTTGICIMDAKTQKIVNTEVVSAKYFNSQEQYWQAHLDLLDVLRASYKGKLILSIEDYILYATKATNQINSHMETSQLIGALKMWCAKNKVPYTIRPAVQVKKRWANHILQKKGFIRKEGRAWYDSNGSKLVTHTLDAIRHAAHCMYFENKKEKCK